MVSVGYVSSCSSLNFFNLINLGSSMGIPNSLGETRYVAAEHQMTFTDNPVWPAELFFCFCCCRILYTLVVESCYSCMRCMISRQRNSVVQEKQRVGNHC